LDHAVHRIHSERRDERRAGVGDIVVPSGGARFAEFAAAAGRVGPRYLAAERLRSFSFSLRFFFSRSGAPFIAARESNAEASEVVGVGAVGCFELKLSKS